MRIEELKKGHRVYVRHPERAYRSEFTVAYIYPDRLPNGDYAVEVRTVKGVGWISGLSQLQDADTVDAEEEAVREAELTEKHRQRLCPVINAWVSGLRKPSEIASACKISPGKAASQIKQAKCRGFIQEQP